MKCSPPFITKNNLLSIAEVRNHPLTKALPFLIKDLKLIIWD